MKLRGALAVLLTFTGCSIFGGENDPSSGADPDSGAESGAPVRPAPLTCGGTNCASGEKCCITDSGRKCEALCAGFDFECLGANQCAVGMACCFVKNSSRCMATCPSRVMCESDAECGASGICKAAKCTPATLTFTACAQGGSNFFDLPGNGGCSLP